MHTLLTVLYLLALLAYVVGGEYLLWREAERSADDEGVPRPEHWYQWTR
jgi:hypothetical protein